MTDEKRSGKPPAPDLPSAVPVATALIVGLLVALGVEGAVRDRFIRTSPGSVFWAFTLAILGVSIPVLAAATRGRWTRKSWWSVLTAVLASALVVSGALLAVKEATDSVSEREQPDLVVTAASSAAGSTISVSSTALSLRPQEKLLLRVIAVRPKAAGLLPRLCRYAGGPGSELVPLGDEGRTALQDVAEPVRTLYWDESGPSSTGAARAAVDFSVVPAEFSHVCAFAALVVRARETDRVAMSMIDLRHAGPYTASSPAPQPQPSTVEATPAPASPSASPSATLSPSPSPAPSAASAAGDS